MNKHLIKEIVKQLDFLNTGMWYVCDDYAEPHEIDLPDFDPPDEIEEEQMTEDEEVIESAQLLVSTIDLELKGKEFRSPFTIPGVWHNFALMVRGEMEGAMKATTECKVELILKCAGMLENTAMWLLGDNVYTSFNEEEI